MINNLHKTHFISSQIVQLINFSLPSPEMVSKFQMYQEKKCPNVTAHFSHSCEVLIPLFHVISFRLAPVLNFCQCLEGVLKYFFLHYLSTTMAKCVCFQQRKGPNWKKMSGCQLNTCICGRICQAVLLFGIKAKHTLAASLYIPIHQVFGSKGIYENCT